MDSFIIASDLLFFCWTKAILPIPRASSRRLRFSALAAARCRFVFCVFAFARDWFEFVVRVAGCDDDVARSEDCGNVRFVGGLWV